MNNPTAPTHYFNYYMQKSTNPDLIVALVDAGKLMQSTLAMFSPEKKDYRYEKDKWSVVEVLHHLIDTERILCYRALVVARNDNHQSLPSFDQEAYMQYTKPITKTIKEANASLKILRACTIDLFTTFSPANLKNKRRIDGCLVSTFNIGNIIVGHELHHIEILKKKYLP